MPMGKGHHRNLAWVQGGRRLWSLEFWVEPDPICLWLSVQRRRIIDMRRWSIEVHLVLLRFGCRLSRPNETFLFSPHFKWAIYPHD